VHDPSLEAAAANRPQTPQPFPAGARNRLVLRAVNDRIAELTEWSKTGVSLFVCECNDQACALSLEITAADYERIRADESQFVVFPGHEQPHAERVVEHGGRFVVVADTERGR
jgi:hypothetical protein